MEKTRFDFNSRIHLLVEIIENPDLIMYWERTKEVCPNCREVIVKGEHCVFDKVEIWMREDKIEKDCKLNDLVFLGKTENRTLLLTKDKVLEVISKSKKFSNLKD